MKKSLLILSLALLTSLPVQATEVTEAWGQPMPVECQKPAFNGLQYVYPKSCFKPWFYNLLHFWKAFD